MSSHLGKLKVLGIGGSLRKASYSHLALEHAAGLVREMGCSVELFDPRRMELPFCNGDKTEPWPAYPAVGELRRLVSEAHAIILSTPEYHGGMSGVLKNALDLLDREHLEGKVVGGISVLGGKHNSNALNDLRTVMRWCHAWMIPEQVAIGQVRTTLAEGRIRDADLLQRFEDFAHGLVWRTARLNGLHSESVLPPRERRP